MLNIVGIVLSLTKLVLPVLYAYCINPKGQINLAKIYYDELGSMPFDGTIE